MRVGKNPHTGESEIYLTAEETQQMKDIVRSASLPVAREFYQIIKEL